MRNNYNLRIFNKLKHKYFNNFQFATHIDPYIVTTLFESPAEGIKDGRLHRLHKQKGDFVEIDDCKISS